MSEENKGVSKTLHAKCVPLFYRWIFSSNSLLSLLKDRLEPLLNESRPSIVGELIASDGRCYYNEREKRKGALGEAKRLGKRPSSHPSLAGLRAKRGERQQKAQAGVTGP